MHHDVGFQELPSKLGAVRAIHDLVGTNVTQTEVAKKKFSKHLSETLRTSQDYNLLEEVGYCLPSNMWFEPFAGVFWCVV